MIMFSDAILAHAQNSLRFYNGNLLLTLGASNGGLWSVYDSSLTARATLNLLCGEAMRRHNAQQETRGLPREEVRDLRRAELDDLQVALVSGAMTGRIANITPSDVDTYPIVPFNDGTHLHLDYGVQQTCNCDIRPMLMLNHGWNIPPPRWDLLDEPPMLLTQFPQTFFEAIARHLWGTSKDTDFLASPTSNAGKSSMASALAQALPGAVAIKQAHTTLTPQRRKFSAHTIPLTDARIVIYDEVGKVDADQWTSTLFELTPPELDVEHKGVDVVTRTRFGNAVFLGEAPPAIDASVQGVKGRIGYTSDLLLGPIDRYTRDQWLSYTEVARLRAWMLSFALDATPGRVADGYYLSPDRDQLIADLLPEDVSAMRERFAGNGGAWLSNHALDAAMTDMKITSHSGSKARAKFIKQCWPRAQAVRTADGRGWRGIGNDLLRS